jgi:hypothetical protein
MPKPLILDSPCIDPFEFVQTIGTMPEKKGPDFRLAMFEARERWIEQQEFPIYHEYVGKAGPVYKDDGHILTFLKKEITKHTPPKSHQDLRVSLHKGRDQSHCKIPHPKVVQTSS